MSPTRYRHRVPEGGWTGTSARVRFASGARGSNPRDGATYDGLADTTGQPLRPTPWAADLRRFSTTSISTTEGGSSDESYMLVGDFRQCLVGMRTSGINLEVLREGTVTDSSGESWNATSSCCGTSEPTCESMWPCCGQPGLPSCPALPPNNERPTT